jgi:hypothetical protein
MIEIYFGCSMRGGFNQVSQEDLRKLQMSVKDLGHQLVTEHQTSPTFEADESPHTNTHIHDRDYGFLVRAKLGIFEISNPSLGVGGEISDMIHLGKPVLCLLKKGLESNVSAYTQGKQGSKHVTTPFECYAYESVQDAKDKMRKFIERYSC